MGDSQPTTESEQLRLIVDAGFTGDQTLHLRVSPEGAEELKALMEAEGVFAGGFLEHSAGPELIGYAASFAGGLSGLAAVLKVFFDRNQHKSITFSRGGEPIEIKGHSKKESDAVIDRVLGDAHKAQLEQDEEGKRIAGKDSEPP